MKPGKIIKTSALLILISFLLPLSTMARELYALSWHGTVYKSSGGRIVALPYSQKDIIAQVAANNGIDARGLTLVYVAEDHDIEVVFAASGEYVADIFQLEYNYVDVANSDGSQAVRQSFIFTEAYGSAIGSAFGIERSRFGGNGERISFSYKGNFQFSFPDVGEVYSGTFTTGKRIRTPE